MEKKIIFVILIATAGILGLMMWASGNQASSPSLTQLNTKSSLTVADALYDFGTISMVNGKVSYVFKVFNSTDKDLNIESVTTSCMCTAAYIVNGNSRKGPFGMRGMGYVPKANEVIKAGEYKNIEVVYDPNAHGPSGVGNIDRFVYLTEAGGGTLNLEIKALVTP